MRGRQEKNCSGRPRRAVKSPVCGARPIQLLRCALWLAAMKPGRLRAVRVCFRVSQCAEIC